VSHYVLCNVENSNIRHKNRNDVESPIKSRFRPQKSMLKLEDKSCKNDRKRLFIDGEIYTVSDMVSSHVYKRKANYAFDLKVMTEDGRKDARQDAINKLALNKAFSHNLQSSPLPKSSLLPKINEQQDDSIKDSNREDTPELSCKGYHLNTRSKAAVNLCRNQHYQYWGAVVK